MSIAALRSGRFRHPIRRSSICPSSVYLRAIRYFGVQGRRRSVQEAQSKAACVQGRFRALLYICTALKCTLSTSYASTSQCSVSGDCPVFRRRGDERGRQNDFQYSDLQVTHARQRRRVQHMVCDQPSNTLPSIFTNNPRRPARACMCAPEYPDIERELS